MEYKTYKRLSYVLEEPLYFSKEKKYPVIIFLTGAGSRGCDLSLVSSSPFFSAAKEYGLNAMIYAPQCHANTWFDIFEQLTEFVEYAINTECADKERIYLLGTSMGAYAAWQLAMSKPEWFAALVPICGGGMYWNSERLKHINIWAFHGRNDKTVLVDESIKMVDRVNECGGDARLTIWEGIGHDAWIKTYQYQKLYEWLFRQCRKSNPICVENRYTPEYFG